MSSPVALEIRDDVALIVIDNPPVNALSHAVRAGVCDALARALEDDAVAAVVLVCAGRTFMAGADIKEFGRPPVAPSLRDMLAALDASTKPTTAAIHGTALGGGFETALCCHYRVAVSSAKVGLPESQLGLLPGAGGTQRLPRLVGARKALDMMIGGRPISAVAGHGLGIVDRVIDGGDVAEAAVAFARERVAAHARPMRVRDLPVESVDSGFFAAYREGMARRTRGFEAPERIVRCVEAAASQPFDAGMQVERELFEACLASTQSAAMRHVFFAERAAGKVPGLDPEAAPRAVNEVAVVGAGTMGAGIALACLDAGLPVTLLDSSADALARGAAGVHKILDAQVAKDRIDASTRDARLDLLETSEDFEAVANADLVIEAVFETMAIKERVFARLDGACKPGAILATNTSTLDVDRIAAATRRPEDVIGLHFFSPAHVMRLLEIVRGARTDDAVIATSLAFAKAIGKLGVVVGNCFGFVGNRMLYGYGRESQMLLLEGASPQQIDAALTDWGMAMGPNAVGDLAGLDVGYKVRQERTDRPDDPCYYRVSDMLAERGRFGQKTGAGIYRYEAGSRVPLPDPEVEAMIAAEAARLGVTRRTIDDAEIVARCIDALTVEGARILEDGIATRAGDIDVIWTNGYGFPRYRGGPMFSADTEGIAAVCERVRDFAARFGEEYWRLPKLLERLAADGGRFADLQEVRS